jgi:DNA-binding response OmpR family regulator
MEKIVLFMDNAQDFLEVQSALLEQAGYQVLRASTLEAAEASLGERRIHLAILDIRMLDENDEHDISGLTLAQKEEYRPVPKIILTSYPGYEYVREALGLAPDGQPPAVNFLDKDEGPEALIQAVEQAFVQYVRINQELKIRWGLEGELLPPYLASLIVPDLPSAWLVERIGELEDLLRKLFHEYAQITLGRVLVRRERRILLTVFAYPAQGPEKQFIVACGQRVSIRAEEEHYRSLVPHRTGHGAASLVQSAWTMHFGATAYSLSECPVEEVMAFADFYCQQPSGKVLTAVEDLFCSTLYSWYERGREKQQQSIETLCREWLGPDKDKLTQAELERRIEGICQATLAAGVADLDCPTHKLILVLPQGLEFSYLNPAPYLCEECLPVSLPTVCGITQGSLDGASVLVDRAGRTWIVDFGKTGLGPLVRDFVSLETSVKFHILKEANVAERHELERRLMAMRHLAEGIDTKDIGPEAEKALQVIGQIRSLAVDVVGPKMEPYLIGLLFCAAERLLDYQSELKYTKEEMEVFTHILLSMGMICRRLITREDHLQHLPLQAAESLWIDVDNQEVWIEGRSITLPPQRFHLLKYLYDHANQLCTRSAIAKQVFGLDLPDLPPTEVRLMGKDQINTSIGRLRKAIEPDPSHPKYIVTVRGVGYKLVLGDIPARDEL